MTKILKKINELGLIAGLALASLAAGGQTVTNSYTFNIGATLPNNSVTGFTYATNLNISPDFITISNLLVTVDISGGRNSDLYVYLKGPDGTVAVLLNRPGVSPAKPSGYKDTGVDVTFSDSAPNGSIHFYQNVAGYGQNANGQVTGLWQPDGENIDPLSPPADFTGAQTAMLSGLNQTDANGTWTLFAAEVGNGGPTVLNSFSLEIVTVPEPSTVALSGLGGITFLLLLRRRRY